MKIDIYNNTTEQPDLNEQEISGLVKSALLKFGLTDNSEIEIMFVDIEEIRKLNLKHRKIDKPTDILSFPQAQYEMENNILGSLVISQIICKEKKESLDQVIKHGILHLLGYDHETNEEEWTAAAFKIDCTL